MDKPIMLCDHEIFVGRIHLTIDEHVQSSKTSILTNKPPIQTSSPLIKPHPSKIISLIRTNFRYTEIVKYY
jgi:hypothetical protein